MDINQLMMTEAATINAMFKENNIRAKVDKARTVEIQTGYISYALTLAMNERFAKVEAMQRELSTILGNGRRRARLPGDVQCIPVSFPRLALELPHPSPKPLLVTNGVLTSAAPHTLLAGRSYIEEAQDEYIVFDATPHILICGITGAGKSVLLQTMLLSLAASTSPTECKFVIVDLKNEDLVSFECLPHTLTFAGTKAKALDALRFVYAEKEKRVANRGHKPYRLVLVIDEMAQLAGNSEAREILGDLASIGRSKDINLIGATQHPTDKGGLGSLLKANFGVRLVGQVAPGQSHIATSRPQTHADLLPGRGAFLRCEGPHVYRFQGFKIDEKDKGEVTAMARQIARQWGKQPVVGGGTTGGEVVVGRLYTSKTDVHSTTGGESNSVQFPLSVGKPLTEQESEIVRQMAQRGDFNHNGQLSMNKVCMYVFGCKDAQRLAWVRAALEPVDHKIIKLRRTGTGGD